MDNEHTVAEVMTRKVVTLFEEDNLERVCKELGSFRFRHLPVVDDGKLVGMFSQRDLLRVTLAGIDHSPAERAKEARALEQLFVRDVMRTDVVSVHPEDTLSIAAQKILESHDGAVPVIDGAGMLTGILTEHDITRAATELL